jgi:hypothetical protein
LILDAMIPSTISTTAQSSFFRTGLNSAIFYNLSFSLNFWTLVGFSCRKQREVLEDKDMSMKFDRSLWQVLSGSKAIKRFHFYFRVNCLSHHKNLHPLHIYAITSYAPALLTYWGFYSTSYSSFMSTLLRKFMQIF